MVDVALIKATQSLMDPHRQYTAVSGRIVTRRDVPQAVVVPAQQVALVPLTVTTLSV